MREALLTDVGFEGVVDELVVLGAFAIVLLPVGRHAVQSVDRAAKRYGVLGSY